MLHCSVFFVFTNWQIKIVLNFRRIKESKVLRILFERLVRCKLGHVWFVCLNLSVRQRFGSQSNAVCLPQCFLRQQVYCIERLVTCMHSKFS